MNAELISTCDRIIGALLNGFFQGIALTAFVWCCLKFVPRTNASTRHVVWLTTLILVAILPAANFRPKEKMPQLSSLIDGEVLNLRQEVNAGAASTEADGTRAQTEEAAPDANANDADTNAGLAGISRDLPSSWSAGADSAAPALGPIFSKLSRNWPIAAPNGASAVIVALWLAVAALLLLRLVWQLWILHRLTRESSCASKEIRELFARTCVEQKMRRAARLILSPGIEIPMAVGFWRPLVLLPEKIMEQAAVKQLHQILRHEIAHLGRRDDWANLAQQVIKAILFFHPMVWWISRRLSIEREIACDDQVLALGHNPRSYALFLTEFACRSKCREWAAASAAWSNKSQLKERISMLLDTKRNASPRLGRAKAGLVGLGAALVAVLALYAGPRVVIANEASNEPEQIAKAESEISNNLIAAEPDAVGVSSEAARAKPVPHPKPAVAVSAAVAPIIASTPAAPSAFGVPTGTALASVPVGPSSSAPMIAAAGADSDNAYSPDKARAKNRKPANDDSIERRLARLEAMVEKLTAETRAKRKTKENFGDIQLDLKGPKFNEWQMQKLEEDLKSAKLSDEDMARIKEQAHQAGDMAKRETERARREIERARKDAQRGQNEFSQGTDELKAQRQALEQQRRGLEKQMRDLERQMQKLEKQQQKIEGQTEHRENPEHEEHSDDDGPRHKEKK